MLNAARALASLEKFGAALTGIAEGNVERGASASELGEIWRSPHWHSQRQFWMLDERERSNPLRRAKHIFNSKFKIAFGHAGYGCAGFSQVR